MQNALFVGVRRCDEGDAFVSDVPGHLVGEEIVGLGPFDEDAPADRRLGV